LETDLKEINNQQVILKDNLHYIFDYIITLEQPLLRELIV
jgi:hypothetical protein